MAGLSANSKNVSRTQSASLQAVHLIVHPDYDYWRRDWIMLRDCLAGEREVKAKRERYLSALKGQDQDDYNTYLERATYHNMVAQTQTGMVGQVFRREPLIRNLPDRYKSALNRFAKDTTSHTLFAKTVMREQIGMGRFGVLVDAPREAGAGALRSYAVGYTAENIIDWDYETIDGEIQPVRVLLREYVRDDYNTPQKALSSAEARQQRQEREAARRAGTAYQLRNNGSLRLGGHQFIVMFRELVLEETPQGRVYRQYLFREDPTSAPVEVVTPPFRGNPLTFIPFKFFGATSNTPDVEKSPLLDIARLNISHYRTMAELEYGRLFTALPIYYAPALDSEEDEYHIGPNTVWEIPDGQMQPGILEYKGQGLSALVDARKEKEYQIASIGGRFMPGTARSGGESDNQVMMREANEQALLLDVVQALEEGMSDVVRWFLMFRDLPLSQTEDLRYEIDTRFLSQPIGAREMRAIHLMYTDGIVPVDTLYEYLYKAEILSQTMTLEEFKTALQQDEQFLNAPNAQAKQRGFSDRAQELEQTRLAREQEMVRDEPEDREEPPEGGEA